MSTPIKVLLVDDDEDDYVLTRDLLEDVRENDFDLTWIAEPEEALAAIKAEAYDV